MKIDTFWRITYRNDVAGKNPMISGIQNPKLVASLMLQYSTRRPVPCLNSSPEIPSVETENIVEKRK